METNNIKTIIIEDEPNARALLRNYCSEISKLEIVAECEDGFNGAKKINELNPTLILLDIQMPKLNGFEMLELLTNPPIVVFTTAFDEFALKAFECNAADYLLKPYSKDRFKQAINKAIVKIEENKKNTNSYNRILSYLNEQNTIIQRVAVKSGSEISIIPTKQIHWIEACDDYVILHTQNEQYVKESTMKYFETHLDPNEFVRIHRSNIVRIDQISKIESYEKDSYLVILKNSEKLNVSRSGYKLLREMLKL
jgi:two-component system, LytTR family, response regulator